MIQPLVVACIFADFDLDVLSPSCLLYDMKWSSVYDLLLQLVLPPLLFVFLLAQSLFVTYGVVRKAMQPAKNKLGACATLAVTFRMVYRARRSIPPQWRSTQFRLASRTPRTPHGWGCIVRVVPS